MKPVRNTGIVGLAAIGLFGFVFDIIVMKKGKQSLSGGVWQLVTDPYYGPAFSGFWTALTWHFFMDRPKI